MIWKLFGPPLGILFAVIKMLKITWLPAQASTDAALSFPHIEAQFQGWVHQCPSPQEQIRDRGANEGVLTVTLSLSQGLSIALPPSSSKSTKSILKDGNHNAVLASFLVWTMLIAHIEWQFWCKSASPELANRVRGWDELHHLHQSSCVLLGGS